MKNSEGRILSNEVARGGSCAARPSLVVAALLVSSCGARSVYLDGDGALTDGGSSNPNSNPDAIAPGVSTVVEDQETAVTIAVDEGRVYWLSILPNSWGEAWGPAYARVRSCLKSGCASTITTYDSITFDWNAHSPRPADFAGLAVGGDNVYWARLSPAGGMAIMTCPSAGCSGAPKVIANSVDLSSMTVDETHIYWTSPDDTAVLRLPLTGGGTPQAIALNETMPAQIATSATHAYWIANAGQANSVIKRVVKQGGEPPVLMAMEQNQASLLALDSEFFYWANSYSVGSISRCPLSGCVGAPTVIVANQNRPRALVADGKSIFWMSLANSLPSYQIQAAVNRCPVEACDSAMETWAVQTFDRSSASMAADQSDVYWVAQGADEPISSGFYPHATIYRHAK